MSFNYHPRPSLDRDQLSYIPFQTFDSNKVSCIAFRERTRLGKLRKLPLSTRCDYFVSNVRFNSNTSFLDLTGLIFQVFMPLVQGIGYNLFLLGWRHWNKSVTFHGDAIGTRIRRWWWKANNWTIPGPLPSKHATAPQVKASA